MNKVILSLIAHVENRLFYNCVLSYLAKNASKVGGDLTFDTDLSAFLI